jgi:hypothetical protein
MGAVAASEADATATRQRRKAQETAENGGHHGGPRPYGFEADGLTVSPHEADVIRDATRRILAGQSLRSVTLALNRAGECGVSGKPFQAARLARILLGPRVIGLRAHNGATYPAQWPALISETDQIELRAILRDPARSMPGRPARHLLAGLVRCGHCGAPMKWKGATRRNRASYACMAPPRGCGRILIRADKAEASVIERVIERNFSGRRRVADVLGSPASTEPALPDLAAERGRLDALADAYARGDVTLEQLTRATAAIRERIADTEERIATAAYARAAAAASESLRQRWTELTEDERRTALASLVKSITVQPAAKRPGRPTFDPSRIAIEWPDFDGEE